jgi:hypothetical protein
MRAPVCILAALSVYRSPGLLGQSASELSARGRAAYHALEYETAAVLLRGSLSAGGPEALEGRLRSVTYAYLGATELFRGDRVAARIAFDRALQSDPRFRLDTLEFPPEVTAAFDTARRATTYVTIRAPPDTVITVGVESYAVRLYASTLHEITVDLLDDGGWAAQRLYAGLTGDSLDVRWDGTISDRAESVAGTFTVQVVSRRADGPERTVRLPLEVTRLAPDPLPSPPRPEGARAQRSTWAAVGALGTGLAAGLATAALPTVVTTDGAGARQRYVVAGALGLAGLIGFTTHLVQGGRSDATADAEALAAPEQAARAVRKAGDRLYGVTRLRIMAGATQVDPESP